ncbi:MAG: hypothetical protein AVDCRST_MAG56-6382 [uncultured Cytophagales bacterium]|uniref:Uncharacterized protein n=1 Tax=uncultured Cytophagales bacterium TaxID=158755 RepID=A0A6J4KS21_9SPHI|nr:MAG: hypothetical protein AVDCRST_MAG56-6382 [uncultured Cytophagales bacterium]
MHQVRKVRQRQDHAPAGKQTQTAREPEIALLGASAGLRKANFRVTAGGAWFPGAMPVCNIAGPLDANHARPKTVEGDGGGQTAPGRGESAYLAAVHLSPVGELKMQVVMENQMLVMYQMLRKPGMTNPAFGGETGGVSFGRISDQMAPSIPDGTTSGIRG